MKKTIVIILFFLVMSLVGCDNIWMEHSLGVLVRTSNPNLQSGFRCAQYMEYIYYSDKNQLVKEDKTGSMARVFIQNSPAGMTVCGQGIFVAHDSLSTINQYDQNGDEISKIEGVSQIELLHATENGLYFSALYDSNQTGNSEIFYYNGFHLNVSPPQNLLDETEAPFRQLPGIMAKSQDGFEEEVLTAQCYDGADNELLIMQRGRMGIALDRWGLFKKSGLALTDILYMNLYLGIVQNTIYELSDIHNEPVYVVGKSIKEEKIYSLPVDYLYSDAYLIDNQRIVVLGSKWENNGRRDIFSPIQCHLSDILVEIDLTNESVTTLLTTNKQERILTYSKRYVYTYANGEVLQTDLSNNTSAVLYKHNSRTNIEFETCGGYLFAHSADGNFLFKIQV